MQWHRGMIFFSCKDHGSLEGEESSECEEEVADFSSRKMTARTKQSKRIYTFGRLVLGSKGASFSGCLS